MVNSVRPHLVQGTLHLKFDLKGSIQNRDALNKRKVLNRKAIAKLNFSVTLKDNEIRKILKVKPELINLRLKQRMKVV